jgi:DNA-binding GntR family transcriptional regulator
MVTATPSKPRVSKPRPATPGISRPNTSKPAGGTAQTTHWPAKLAEQVYEKLKAQIHDFVLLAGDRFSEADLSERLGVSRTPIREALFRLRAEGFLEVEFKSGWFVKPIDFEKLDQLYDLRIVLELASVSKLTSLVGSSGVLDTLRNQWLVPPEERLTNPKAVGELDEAFHQSLVLATGNTEIARVHQEVTDRIRIVRRLDFTRSDRIEATYLEHGKILRAVLQRKADQAQLLLRSHIEQSKVEVRKITLAALHQAKQIHAAA